MRAPARPPLVARHPGPALVVAAVLWGAAGLVSRAAPLPGPVLAFWRCLVGAGIDQGVLAARGRRPSWHDLRVAALGGIGFGLSVAFLFVAYKTTTLLSANVIACLQPLVLGLVAHRYAGRLDGVAWGATGAAALGTVIVVVGSSAHTGTWSLRGDLLAVAATAANVLYILGTKRAASEIGPLRFQAAMLWVAAIVVLPVAVATGGAELVPGAGGVVGVLALIAVGGSGHLVFSAAQRHVSVAASSSILLFEVIAVSVGAAIVFDQSITAVQALGMLVVTGSIAVWIARTGGEAAAVEPEPAPFGA
ncbi:MAG: DMT family transporter [Acidimicrobiales bacterium]